jgi:hypothetical protein
MGFYKRDDRYAMVEKVLEIVDVDFKTILKFKREHHKLFACAPEEIRFPVSRAMGEWLKVTERNLTDVFELVPLELMADMKVSFDKNAKVVATISTRGSIEHHTDHFEMKRVI